MAQYHMYFLINHMGTLYTGVTNNLERRMYEHREGLGGGFTKKYNISKLVYYVATNDVQSAIAREKQIKGWRRSRKVDLIESANPSWLAHSADCSAPPPDPSLRSG